MAAVGVLAVLRLGCFWQWLEVHPYFRGMCVGISTSYGYSLIFAVGTGERCSQKGVCIMVSVCTGNPDRRLFALWYPVCTGNPARGANFFG